MCHAAKIDSEGKRGSGWSLDTASASGVHFAQGGRCGGNIAWGQGGGEGICSIDMCCYVRCRFLYQVLSGCHYTFGVNSRLVECLHALELWFERARGCTEKKLQ